MEIEYQRILIAVWRRLIEVKKTLLYIQIKKIQEIRQKIIYKPQKGILLRRNLIAPFEKPLVRTQGSIILIISPILMKKSIPIQKYPNTNNKKKGSVKGKWTKQKIIN